MEVLERLDIKAFVRMPIFVDRKLWGIINLYQSNTRLWKEDDLEFLQRMVLQISSVIQQKQYLDELQTQAQQEEAIANIVQRINGSLNVKDLFRSATQEIRNLLEVDRAVVYHLMLIGQGKFSLSLPEQNGYLLWKFRKQIQPYLAKK